MLPDTLKILNLSPTPLIAPEYLGLLGVLVGASISFLGNWALAKRQAHIEIQRVFFLRRIEVYVKLAELVWEAHSVQINDVPDESPVAYPIAYDSFEKLKGWLKNTVAFVDKSFLLLDQNTYDAFIALDKQVVDHLKELKLSSTADTVDVATRNLGRDQAGHIQDLVSKIMESIRHHMRQRHGVDLPKIR